MHDAVRGLRTGVELSSDSGWARQLAGFRSEVSKLLQAEIENLPGQVRRVLRPRPAKETGPNATVDASRRRPRSRPKLVLAAACRNYSGELAFSEATRRVHYDLQNYFDSGTQS